MVNQCRKTKAINLLDQKIVKMYSWKKNVKLFLSVEVKNTFNLKNCNKLKKKSLK